MNKFSPLFYIGDKSKYANQIIDIFPEGINTIFEVFSGGAGLSINSDIDNIKINDIEKNVTDIHRFLIDTSKKNDLPTYILKLAKKYKLIVEGDLALNNDETLKLKREYPKTYLAKLNKDSFESLRDSFNKEGGIEKLYLLKLYSFNRMIRFNSKGEFNVPVGNLIINNKVIESLKTYSQFAQKEIVLSNLDFKDIDIDSIKDDELVYLDPPYLITNNKYTKGWDERNEIDFWEFVFKLNKAGKKFIISNVSEYQGESNDFLISELRNYNHKIVDTNYINHKNNKQKKSKEYLIWNYE